MVASDPGGHSADLDFLLETLVLADQELVQRAGTAIAIQSKPDASLVTEADLASEQVIIERIQKHYPDDLIYSEEAGLSSREKTPGQHIWIIDPLDGTTNFANNYPFYCISVARGVLHQQHQIEVLLGGVRDTPRRRTFYGIRGGGAFCDGKPLRVRPNRPFEQCFLVTGFYYQRDEELQQQVQRFSRIVQRCQSIRRDGAAALDLAYVAAGVYDAFWEVGLQPWDVAAGSLLVQEAGGLVANYPGHQGPAYDIEALGCMAGSASTVDQLAGLL